MKKLIVLLAVMLTFATTAFAQLGSLSTDLVFTPVTPCRIMDTRGVGPRTGIMAAGSTRTFYGISSSSNYTGQGGISSNCDLPFTNNVASVVLNFTVVTPDTGGFITAFPADAIWQPLAATVNFSAGAIVGNNATLKIAQTMGNGDFKVYTTSNLHLVADIVGYYSKPVSGSLVCEDTTAVSSPINIEATSSQYFAFVTATACSAGFTQVALRCYTNNGLASAFEVTSGDCGANSTMSATTLFASRRCCSIPGR